MTRPLVRLLILPRDQDRDAAGRGIGDDWHLLDLGTDDDGTRYHLTTDRIHASELGDYPGLEPAALGAWLVMAINAAAGAGAGKWPRRVGPLPPPERAWFEVEGRQWATNRHVLVPRDDPPFPALSWLGPESMDAEQIQKFLADLPDGRPIVPDAGVSPRNLVSYLCEGVQTFVAERYAPLLLRGEPSQGPDPQGPIMVRREGRLVAVVMPSLPG